MKLLEYVLREQPNQDEKNPLIDMNSLAASARILWGAAFCLAILKTIKVS